MEELKYNTGFKRFWAAVIDACVFLPLIFISRWIYETPGSIYILFSWTAFLIFASVFYSIILHYKFGQTYGKWVVGVKVLDIGEKRKLTFRQAILRNIFELILAVFATLYYGYLMVQGANNLSLIDDYIEFSDTPFWILTIIELITMMTNYKRRAVHDFIAGSVVVRSRK